MLTALNKNGNRICLADIHYQHTLKQLKEKESFFCPMCNEKLILKVGVKKVSHFAHYRNQTCTENYENETNYHLSGKLKLYLWLKKLGLEPELEVYDKTIKQRPDIRFSFQSRKYALEYQCTSIPEALFIKRTVAYQNNGYTPLWILGGNYYNRKSSQVVSLSDFQYLSLSPTTNGISCLRYYCPNANLFIFLGKILPVSSRNALATVTLKSPEQLRIVDMLNPPLTFSYSEETWQKEIKDFKLFYAQSPQSYRNPFLKELYKNYLYISYLPPEIGLPVIHSVYIKTPIIVWQGFLYLDVFKNKKTGDLITMNMLKRAFQTRVWKKHILLRPLPMARRDASYALLEYICLLVSCRYLTRVKEDVYKINYQLCSSKKQLEQEEKEGTFYDRNKSVFPF